DRLLRAARAEASRRGLDGVVVSGDDAALGDACQSADSLRVTRTRGVAAARISLPRWSLADYLSCFDDRRRGQLLRICAQAVPYERFWRVALDGDVEPMLALCRDAGLVEINEAFFKALLGTSTEFVSGLVVRSADGGLAGFSVVLHDAGALREKLAVVSRREK